MTAAKKTQTAPNIKGYPIVGSLPDFARDPIAFITHLKDTHGDVVTFSLAGNKSALFSDPKDVDRVLMETGKHYGKFKPTYAMRTILGNGLVISEGDFWKRQRKLAAPAFHHQSIKRYADQMVAYTQDMLATWHADQGTDIHQEMMTLTQRIIMKVLFDVDVLNNADQASKAFDAMMQAIGAEISSIEAILPPLIPTPTRRKMIEGVKYIDGVLLDIIEARKNDTNPKHDLLTMLMEARDDDGQPMSTEQLLDEIRTLYLAGHETTAATLTWTWLQLSKNPEVYDKLIAEIDQVLNGRVPNADDVSQLPYCNAVVKESLRTHPVAWITQRVALADVEVGGYTIEEGTFIFVSPWIIHHDERWYDAPNSFIPERWLQEKSQLPPRHVYLPFGGGPHICIGNGLAMMEAVLLLATFLQHFRVAVLPDHPVEIELAGTLRPKHGLQATLQKRER